MQIFFKKKYEIDYGSFKDIYRDMKNHLKDRKS